MFDDLFDEMAGGDDLPLGSGPDVTQAGILIVAAKAPHGSALHAEERAHLASVHIPMVVFEAVDPTTGEVTFGNASEFQEAMGSLLPPSIDEAIAWSTERLVEIFEAHREAVEAAELDAAVRAPNMPAPGAGFVTSRARMPHSTGRDRGQKR
ncbi:hypothetical protein XH83_33810 [Bradyrhizobium sp. CCBAU 53351]|uniref:hypothetical protein n=1 Tax=Bradyrhizobium sp. CCBAU 53351 TaxID=1325114 RepID=UPI0018898BFF|nr:hypothetical protein [Bradyrhizobium sp. CCBAU 53351]QOZ79923.1 hypothetical protein XH83_33810 [Bradyrhizobium sp. CCBAU 53351]